MLKYKALQLPPQCYDQALHGTGTYHQVFACVMLELLYLGRPVEYNQGTRSIMVRVDQYESLSRMIPKWVTRHQNG